MDTISLVRSHSRPARPSGVDGALLDLAAGARLVLVGEASHGTEEFYAARAAITRRLISEHGFNAVIVEADWPDAYRINRYVHGRDNDASALDSLKDFTRFPLWMWRNTVVREFVEWLRQWNKAQPEMRRTGFYGMDLYSLHASSAAVISYLEKHDPAAAQRARYRYSCFEDLAEDPQSYGYAASIDASRSCEDEVIEQLGDLRLQAAAILSRDGFVAQDEFFFAQQNALLVKNAERYYRSMFGARTSSWNLRDQHMAETVSALLGHLQAQGQPGRAVVWAHNSHLGDARATEMSERGELNVGQLIRERFGEDALLIGFTTHSGSVSAASNWDEPVRRRRVRPGLPGSFEELFHEAGGDFWLDLTRPGELRAALSEPRLERAIGVIYRPETERLSHYFEARLAEQFDAIIHFDETRALRPLDHVANWETEDLPETYPFRV